MPPSPTIRAKTLRKMLVPSFGEILFWLALAGWGHFACGESWWGVSKFVGCFFLLPHIVWIVHSYAELRWPKFFERLYRLFKNPFVIAATVAVFLGYYLVFAGGWGQVVAFRPDWRGALFILAFGGASVIAVWPPYWVFYRFIKPWAIRTNRQFAGFCAIASIALLYWGAWMTGLILWTSRG